MKKKYWLPVAFLLIVAATATWLSRPYFFICADGGTVFSMSAAEPIRFSIRFVHSVQKTPVEENLVIDNGIFRLESTKYKSFGVGLPFLATEGNFRHEGDHYVLDGMDRRFPKLSLRTGVGTFLEIFVGEKEIKLYEMFPPGTKADLFVAPYYEHFWR